MTAVSEKLEIIHPLIVDAIKQLEESVSAFSYIAQTLELNDRPKAAAAHARYHSKISFRKLDALKEELSLK